VAPESTAVPLINALESRRTIGLLDIMVLHVSGVVAGVRRSIRKHRCHGKSKRVDSIKEQIKNIKNVYCEN
jgi:hypothetical protein